MRTYGEKFIAVVIILMVIYCIGVGFFVFKGIKMINQDGLRGVIERIWIGDKKD